MEALRGPNQKSGAPKGGASMGIFFPSLGVHSVEFHAIHIPAEKLMTISVGIPSQMCKRPPARLICPTRSLFLRAAMARGFRSLDQVTSDTEFRSRGCLMRVVPKVMRGAFRTVLRLSFQEAAEARAAGNVEQEIRA